MKIIYLDYQTNKELLISLGRYQAIPRKGENVFINDHLYEVYKIHYYYSSENANDNKIEIELIPR